jgi:HNH endonuclease
MVDSINYFGLKSFKNKGGYLVYIDQDKHLLYAHRLVWKVVYGDIPPGMHIHHLDENKMNNNIANLLMLPHSQHMKAHWRKRKINPNQLLLAI